MTRFAIKHSKLNVLSYYIKFVSIAKRKIINFFFLRDYFMLDTILFSQNRLSYGKVRPVLHFRERCPYKPSLKNVNEIVMSLLHLFCCKISLNTNALKTAAKYCLVKKQDLHSYSCNSFQWYLH